MSVRPHRWKPTRLPRPWDTPGKNTGVGCHFFLQCTKVKSERKGSCSVVSDSSRPHGLRPTRLLCPWDLPGKSTGVGCQFSHTQNVTQLGEEPGFKPKGARLQMSNHSCTDPSIHVAYILYLYYSTVYYCRQ